jgi:[ribosomal protein S5]-alanine N-acetyltransferase
MKVIENYEICYPNPLNLKVGDQIELFEKEVPEKWRGWNWCKDSTGNEGWISESYFMRNSSGAKIVEEYTARELSVKVGKEVELIFEDCGWVWCKKSDGDEGWLPAEVLDGTMELPEFETDRLFMRGVRLDDSESYEKSFANYEVIQHLSHHVPWPYPKGAVRDFLKEMILPDQGIKRWLWAIFLKDKRDDVIGCVDLWKNGCPENRGFWLAKEQWGNGYMSEAVMPVMGYAFEKLGFEKLTFANAVGNSRSRRIKEKTGARFIETRPAKFVDPKYIEHEIWELTKEDWKRNNETSNA